MTEKDDDDKKYARQARMVSLVLAGTMITWMAAQWLIDLMELPLRYAFFFDFAALAAMLWALILTYKIWRWRRSGPPSGRE